MLTVGSLIVSPRGHFADGMVIIEYRIRYNEHYEFMGIKTEKKSAILAFAGISQPRHSTSKPVLRLRVFISGARFAPRQSGGNKLPNILTTLTIAPIVN